MLGGYPEIRKSGYQEKIMRVHLEPGSGSRPGLKTSAKVVNLPNAAQLRLLRKAACLSQAQDLGPAQTIGKLNVVLAIRAFQQLRNLTHRNTSLSIESDYRISDQGIITNVRGKAAESIALGANRILKTSYRVPNFDEAIAIAEEIGATLVNQRCFGFYTNGGACIPPFAKIYSGFAPSRVALRKKLSHFFPVLEKPGFAMSVSGRGFQEDHYCLVLVSDKK